MFKNFRSLVETETGEKVKVFRTDRGGEFLSNKFKKYCEETGLQRQYTSPYSPQQNGVVERRNRTVLEMVRLNLKTMSMPDVLWGEAIAHYVYILNRVQTKALKDSTPFEMWTGRKPHIDHLKVFGCVAHMKIVKGHLKKLEDRSIRLVHLGIEKGSKAYRLLDPNSGKVYVNRDVVFEEERNWVWEKSQRIKATPGVSFTVDGFDLDGDVPYDEEEWASDTPGQEIGSDQESGSLSTWANSQQSNRSGQPHVSPSDSPIPTNTLVTPTTHHNQFIVSISDVEHRL